MRTIHDLAQQAIDIQDASNPLGLTKGFAQATQDLADTLRAAELPSDTNTICCHPIFQLWASKLHDLARMGLSDIDRYGKAYDTCQQLAKRPVHS